MISDSVFKEYLPIITAFLGAFLGYIFNGRKYKIEQFNKDAAESLKYFYSPVFNRLRIIKIELNPEKREKLMEELIEKYTSEDTQLYKSYNPYLIEVFYDLDKSFKKFKMKMKNEYWEEFWEQFEEFYELVEKEYWNIQNGLYKDYPWYQFLTKRGYILKFICQLTVLLYETIQFIVVSWFFIMYLYLWSKIFGQNVIPDWLINNLKNLTFVIISLFFIGVTFQAVYFTVTIDYRRKRKFLRKADRCIINSLNKMLNRKRKVRKKINIPAMYERKNVQG